MKFVKQFLIILSVTCAGEALSYFLPLPIPSSIYGMVILFTGLATHKISYESVQDVGHFLIEIMPVMFIPAAVGILESWDKIKSVWVQYAIVVVVTTVLVMGVSGRVTQHFVERKGKNG